MITKYLYKTICIKLLLSTFLNFHPVHGMEAKAMESPYEDLNVNPDLINIPMPALIEGAHGENEPYREQILRMVYNKFIDRDTFDLDWNKLIPTDNLHDEDIKNLSVMKIHLMLLDVPTTFKTSDVGKRLMTELETRAAENNPSALNTLGIMYCLNREEQNIYQKGIEYLKRAADHGFVHAQLNLAKECSANGAYLKSYGIPMNFTSLEFIKMAADSGFAAAQYYLGHRYLHSRTVEKDIPQALKWFERAAHQGHANAQKWFGELYLNGGDNSFEMKKDYPRGCKFLKMAADKEAFGAATALQDALILFLEEEHGLAT